MSQRCMTQLQGRCEKISDNYKYNNTGLYLYSSDVIWVIALESNTFYRP